MQNVFIYGFLKQRRDVQYAFGFIDLFLNPDKKINIKRRNEFS